MSEREHHGSGVAHTLIFGILLGVLITLLFTTKKGRRLLKAITDESVDRLSHWEDMLKSIEREAVQDTDEQEPIIGEEVDQEVQAIEAPKPEKIEIDEMDEDTSAGSVQEKPVIQKKSKRLFKGVHKKAS